MDLLSHTAVRKLQDIALHGEDIGPATEIANVIRTQNDVNALMST